MMEVQIARGGVADATSNGAHWVCVGFLTAQFVGERGVVLLVLDIE